MAIEDVTANAGAAGTKNPLEILLCAEDTRSEALIDLAGVRAMVDTFIANDVYPSDAEGAGVWSLVDRALGRVEGRLDELESQIADARAKMEAGGPPA